MKYHKLLEEQLMKYLPDNLSPGSMPEKLMSVISDTYFAQDRDKEMIEHAFGMGEEEYVTINNKLEHEVSVRKLSVDKLKEAIGTIDGEERTGNSDDLLMIARYLNQQVSKRKNAEQVFSSLITNLQSGIMLDDESGRFVFINQRFCSMFSIPVSPEVLVGTDSRKSIENNKHLFLDPAKFVSDIHESVKRKELIIGARLELADGRIFERDYIPIFLEQKYKGNLWCFTDVTERIKKEIEYKRMSLVASANKSGVLFTSKNGRIIWANDGFSNLTGYSMDEMIGLTPFELCKGPLTEKKSIDKVLNAFYNGQAFNVEIIYYKKDGSWFWGRSYTQPVKDEQGNVTQFFGIIDDITDEINSEDQFRFALDKIGDHVWEHNFETGRTNFSDSVKHIMGYSKEELDNNTELWMSKIFPADQHLLNDNFKKYSTGLQTHHTIEYRMIHKTGEIRWILEKGVVIERTADLRPLKIIGIQTDITLIKHNEKVLRENEEQLRALTENIPGILYKYEHAADGMESFSYISPDCEKKIGLTEEQLRNFYSILHPDDREREQHISQEARKNNNHYSFEGRFVIPDKPVIWLNLSSSFSHQETDGTKVHTGIILNISKEKEVELGIKLREEKYRNIIANMNLGLLEVDNGSIIHFSNQSFCEMSGYNMEELLNKNATDLFGSEAGSPLTGNKAGKRKKGLSDAFEVMVKNKVGEDRWWLISAATRFNEKGQKVGSIGIHLDITDQKKLEHELQEAKKLAESSSNAKQVFLANMSHEIRTPMNAILGMTNQLTKSSLNNDQLFYLNIIQTSADNLLIIINDILDLSKLEAGRLNLENIGFRADRLIEQAIQVMAHKAEEKGLALTKSFFDKRLSPVLKGDPYRLNQILLNLFSNSIKFTERGIVDISCRVQEDNAENQLVEIKVTDTGIGMEEAFLSNLFQKFRQEDESVTRRFGGTGLGMSICKELVEFMGGHISVKSAKGEGTTVIVIIPLGKGTESDLPVKETGSVNTGILVGKRILVTDDNEMNRLVATTILKEYGAILDEATNGMEALEKLDTGAFDLVLMDIQMPVMDGLQATRIIRQKFSLDLPVIALTALALKGDETKFRDAGMTDYLSKPFEESKLLQVISRCLGKSMIMKNTTDNETLSNGLFNLDKLNEIAKGNSEFVKKMIDLFILQAPSSAIEISEAFKSGDFIKMKQTAHRFKTSLFNIGVHSLSGDILQIEMFDQEKNSPECIEPLIWNVEKVVCQVVNELNTIKSANG
jgi:two-component system, sensor histidine kinase